MAYPNSKDFLVIVLAGLSGAGAGFTYTELMLGLSPLPEAIGLCSLGIFPILGGWLSLNARNVVLFPIGILIGISVAIPSGNDTFAIMLVLASSLFQGVLATAAFFVGYGARRLVGMRKQ